MNKKELNKISQWVTRVTKFSTEYNSAAGYWPAKNVEGKPNTYPKYGDINTAWAPQASKGTFEFLELEFSDYVFPTGIRVYETYNPGALVMVSCKDPSGAWVTLWKGQPTPHIEKKSRIFSPEFIRYSDYPTKHIRLDMDCRECDSWYEIDAVELIGFEPNLNVSEHLQNDLKKGFSLSLFADMPVHIVDNYGTKHQFHLHKIILKHRAFKLYQRLLKEQEMKLNKECADVLFQFLYSDCLELPHNLDEEELLDIVTELGDISNKYEIKRLSKIIQGVKKYGVKAANIISMSIESTLNEDLRRAMKDTELSDLEFNFGHTVLKAHKFIVASRCTFFAAMLTRWMGKQSNQIEINDTKLDIFKQLLEHFYTGETSAVSEKNAVELAVAASEYLCSDLTLPLEIVKKHITQDNLLEVMTLASQFSWTDVVSECISFIKNHQDASEKLKRHPEFSMLDNDVQNLISTSYN